MYELFLTFHELNRIFILFLYFSFFATVFLMKGRPDFQRDRAYRILAPAYMIFVDIQVVLGLLLFFFFSPITAAAFSDFGAAMGDSVRRFYALEHPITGILTMSTGHLAYRTAKKQPDNTKRLTLYLALSGLFILLTVRRMFII